jgi:hypothetical protein
MKLLTDLMKIYNNNDKKYDGELYKSEIMAPLTCLISKDVKFYWLEEINRAFKQLKKAFIYAFILM